MLQSGIHRSRNLGSGQEFEQYRRYVAGDDLRQVDWHLFARSDQLHCRIQSPDTAARVAIVLDTSASMGYQGSVSSCTKLRCASIVAACLGYLAERQGDVIGLFTYGGERYNLPRLSCSELCQRLNVISPSGGSHSIECLGTACDFIHGRGIVVWLSDFLGEEPTVETTLRAFQVSGKACYAIQILDSDELDMPLHGTRRFEDPEEARDITTDPASIREDYILRMKAFLGTIQEACLRQNIPLGRFTSKDDLGKLLAEFLA